MGAQSSKQVDDIKLNFLSDPTLAPSSFPLLIGKKIPLSPSREIGYEIYGDPAAPPTRTILFMHGTPGTRFFFTKTHSQFAENHNIRVLVPERPGYGLSTPCPSRTLLSSARDITAVLDAEDVDNAHVIGYSAGGPFALAFAYLFPERCASVSLVSSLSPNVGDVTRGMTPLSKVGYFLSAKAPGVLKWLVRVLVRDALREVFDNHRADFSEAENAQFAKDEDLRRCFAESTLELYSREHGATAEAEDYILMARDWGFRIEDIGNVDVFLYGGEDDNKCTPGMFSELERALRKSRCNLKEVQLVKGEQGGHHLLFYQLFQERLLCDLRLVDIE